MAEASGMPLRRIVGYVVVLKVLLLFSTSSTAAGTAVSFLLKDSLGLRAAQVSFANFLIALPLYVGFVFGFARDRWSPFGLRDRGYFIVFGALGALLFFSLAIGPPTYVKLVATGFALTICDRFLTAGQGGITTEIGQTLRVTGRLSAVITLLSCAGNGASFFVGGALQSRAESSLLFVGLGVVALLFVPVGAWWRSARRVQASFDSARPVAARAIRDDALRLLRHRPLWPALLIWFLFTFSPVNTPLVFFMTDDLHGTPAHFGWFMGIAWVIGIPVSLLYVRLCRIANLRRLLFWSTVVALPGLLPLLFVHSPTQAIWFALLFGISCTLPTCAYYDLLLRSFPKGLEGTGSSLSDMLAFTAVGLADLLGGWLYDSGGFKVAVIAGALTTLAIFVVLPFVATNVAENADEAAS